MVSSSTLCLTLLLFVGIKSVKETVMLDINVERQSTEYVFEKPHYWSLIFFYQDDGVGGYVRVNSQCANAAAYVFIFEDLH